MATGPSSESGRTGDEAPARAPDVVTVEVDGETIVYHHQTGMVHRLDSVGSLVWRFLDGQTAVDDLVIDLSAAFGVDPEIVRGDVTNLLNRLDQAFLLNNGRAVEPRVGPVPLANPPSR